MPHPTGRKKVKLGDIVDCLDSQRVPISKMKRESGNIPYYGATGIVDYVNDYIFNEELILLGEDGADWLGFANSAFIVKGKSWVNNHAHVLKSKKGIANNTFLKEWMNYSNLDVFTTGSTRKKLNKQTLLGLEISLPPLPEQTHIATILSSLDNNIEATQELIEQTERVKKGMMQRLLTRGIGHTKFKQTELGEIPESWEDLKMKDICEVRQGLQIPIRNRHKDDGPNRFLYITIKYLKELANHEYIENPKKSVICYADDILMTRTGNTGVVITGVSGVFHNNFFLIDYNRNKIDKDYLVYYLKSQSIQKIILDRAGTTTIPDLNHGDFYSIRFLCPSFSEQQKIASILTSFDDKIQVYKEKKAQLERVKKGLMQDLLTGKVRVKF